QDDGEGRVARGKIGNFLRLVIFENTEVFLLEAAHVIPVVVGHNRIHVDYGHRDRNRVVGGLALPLLRSRGLLRGGRRGGRPFRARAQQECQKEQRQSHAAAQQESHHGSPPGGVPSAFDAATKPRDVQFCHTYTEPSRFSERVRGTIGFRGRCQLSFYLPS